MPVRPENRKRYPPEWPLISLCVRRDRAGRRCEWCPAEQGKPHPVTGSRVVLTVAHLHDPEPENVNDANLAALCQRCQLDHDRKHHIGVRRAIRFAAMRTLDLFPEAVP